MAKENSLFFGFSEKLSEEQNHYKNSIFKNQVTIVEAKNGTGKTVVALMASRILEKPVFYIFFPVQESKIGFLPGSLQDKESVYLNPLGEYGNYQRVGKTHIVGR